MKLNLKQRLYSNIGFLILLIIIIALFGAFKINNVNTNLTQVRELDSYEQRQAIDMRGAVHDTAISVRDIILSEGKGDKIFYQQINEYEKKYNDARTILNEIYNKKNMGIESDYFLQIINVEKNTNKELEVLFKAIKNNDYINAKEHLMNKVSPLYSEWLIKINQYIDYKESLISKELNYVQEETGNFKNIIFLITFFALIIGIFIAYRTVNYLLNIVGEEPETIKEFIAKVSKGDLTLEIPTKYKNSILNDLNYLVKNLGIVIKENAEVSKNLSLSSNELNNKSENTKNLVERQQKETDSGAAAITQMTHSLNETAKFTQLAFKEAETASKAFNEGNKEVIKNQHEIIALSDTLKKAMNDVSLLNDNSKKINNVLVVIQSIAEQTNLLALNAAIEAARAGEAGRGFAVVAEEVRNLAKKTKESTEEIQHVIVGMLSSIENVVSIIKNSEEKSVVSANQAKVVGQVLNEINEKIQSLNKMNSEISDTVKEQLIVAEEISSNFNGITTSAGDSYTATVDVQKTSQKLSELALKLKDNVDKFKL